MSVGTAWGSHPGPLLPRSTQEHSLSDQSLHVSEPRGPCFQLPPKLISMASFSGWDQDEDECSCDHAQDRGYLVGQEMWSLSVK